MKIHELKTRQVAQELFIKMQNKLSWVEQNLLTHELLWNTLDISSTIAYAHDRYVRDAAVDLMYIAKWKNARVGSMLHLAETTGIISKDEFDDYMNDIWAIGWMLYKHIQTMLKWKDKE